MNSQNRIFAFLGIITGLILVQACGRDLPSEVSCNFVQNQNLQRVSWNQNVPVDLYLDNSFPQEYEPAVRAAIAEWNKVGKSSRGKEFFRLRGGSPGSSTPQQDSYTKIYLLNTWEDEKQTEQARTTIHWSGSQIYEADVRINEKDFDFYISDTPDYSKVHLESLLIHELGHVLGLAHTTSHESVMQASLANGRSRTEPNATDIKSLTCEY